MIKGKNEAMAGDLDQELAKEFMVFEFVVFIVMKAEVVIEM